MLTHHVQLKILPWDDRAFVSAVDGLVHEIEMSDVPVDSSRAADHAQARLRELGWADAVVSYWRTVEEVFGHTAHWTVYRERPPD
jgi:hypothetical protein